MENIENKTEYEKICNLEKKYKFKASRVSNILFAVLALIIFLPPLLSMDTLLSQIIMQLMYFAVIVLFITRIVFNISLSKYRKLKRVKLEEEHNKKAIYDLIKELETEAKKRRIKVRLSVLLYVFLGIASTTIYSLINKEFAEYISVDEYYSSLAMVGIIIYLILEIYYSNTYSKYKKELDKYCPYCYTKGFTTVSLNHKKINQYVKSGNLIEEWQTTCKNECCGTIFNKNWNQEIKAGKYCPYCYCHTKEFTTTTLYHKKIRSYVKKDESTNSEGKKEIKRTLIEDWEGQYRNECCGKVYTNTWTEEISLD